MAEEKDDKETIENTNELEGDVESQKPLTEEDFFEVLDKAIKADPSKERQSPDEES